MKFTIECEMKDRWVNDFLSMLKYMEDCGKIGHSAIVGFYSDGDGDFRPEFKFNVDFEEQHGYRYYEGKELPSLEIIFDAG